MVFSMVVVASVYQGPSLSPVGVQIGQMDLGRIPEGQQRTYVTDTEIDITNGCCAFCHLNPQNSGAQIKRNICRKSIEDKEFRKW